MILLLVIVSMFVVPTSASSITMTADNNEVKAKLALLLQQNITRLPDQTSTLSLGSDAMLSAAFADALRRANQSAAPSDLQMNLGST